MSLTGGLLALPGKAMPLLAAANAAAETGAEIVAGSGPASDPCARDMTQISLTAPQSVQGTSIIITSLQKAPGKCIIRRTS